MGGSITTRPQESQGQGHGSKVKCHRTKILCPCTSIPQTQTGHIGINTIDTGASTRIPRSRSWLQGQRSQDQNSMLMHSYLSWILHRGRLATLASIPWTQEGPRESPGRGHGCKVKGHRTKMPGPCTPTLDE